VTNFSSFRKRWERLKDYEQRTIRLRCMGLTAAEVAEQEFVCRETVENRISVATKRLALEGSSKLARTQQICYLLGARDALISYEKNERIPA